MVAEWQRETEVTSSKASERARVGTGRLEATE